MKYRMAIAVVAAVLATACGKSGGNPTAPSAAQVSAITVNGPDRVFLGRTESYSASMTGGSAPCSWGGDAPHIGTISPSGVFSGRGNGNVTIWCEAAGVRGTKLVQVVADYSGIWIGTYRVTACQGFGELRDMCDEFRPNRVLPLSGSFTQTNLAATGSFDLGQITAPPVTGQVRQDGSMTLNQTHDGTGIVVLRSEWRVRQDRDGQITGSVTITFTALGFTGNAVVQGEIFNTNRTSRSSMRALALPARSETLEDVLRRMAPEPPVGW
jgi:hypothetical protein